MNEKKLMQLSSAIAGIIAALEFQQRQLSEMQPGIKAHATSALSNTENIISSLRAISANPPPLSKTDAEMLNMIKASLQKVGQEIAKELDRPLVQCKKELERHQAIVANKVTPELIKPGTYNLEPLRKAVSKAQELIQRNSAELDKYFMELKKCQDKFAQAEQELDRLNLPNDIVATTKEVTKLAKNLGTLQAHLQGSPNARNAYQQQFLPLREALEKLRLQSTAFTPQAANAAVAPASTTGAAAATSLSTPTLKN